MKILGYFYIVLGLVWIAAIVGGVFSQTYSSVIQIWAGLVFHAVCMALGMHFLVRGAKSKGRPFTG